MSVNSGLLGFSKHALIIEMEAADSIETEAIGINAILELRNCKHLSRFIIMKEALNLPVDPLWC